MKSSTLANCVLAGITAIWGLTFPVIKSVTPIIDPFVFVAARFFIAALVIFPFIPRGTLNCRRTLFAGFILGALNSGVYVLQSLSLDQISATRCAFLTGTVILWVPLFGRLFLQMPITFGQVFAGFLCLTGLYIMSGADMNGIGLADGVMLISSACFALALLYLNRVHITGNKMFALTFYQILFTCPLPIFVGVLKQASWLTIFKLPNLMALGFCALFATVITLLLQVYYQPRTSSVSAALLFSFEPLWAALFSSLFFGETLTASLLIGGAIMIISVTIPEIYLLFRVRAGTGALR